MSLFCGLWMLGCHCVPGSLSQKNVVVKRKDDSVTRVSVLEDPGKIQWLLELLTLLHELDLSWVTLLVTGFNYDSSSGFDRRHSIERHSGI